VLCLTYLTSLCNAFVYCMYVSDAEAEAAAQSVPMRSVSDDQLLSHSEAFASLAADSGISSLRCGSDDFQNLTKCDDGDEMMQRRPSCSHDVPENCTSSCWTFVNYTNCASRSLMPNLPCSSVTQQFPMTKSKSSEHCCLNDVVTDQPTVNQSTCFYPRLW